RVGRDDRRRGEQPDHRLVGRGPSGPRPAADRPGVQPRGRLAAGAHRPDHPSGGAMSPDPLLRVRDLRVSYPTPRGLTQVVHGVDLDLAPGERVALVGESGSGKSVTARAVLRLDPDASLSGRIELNGVNLLDLPAKRM